MRFGLDAEQADLDDMLERLLGRWTQEHELGDPAARRDLWQRLAELGVSALWVGEEHGGGGAGAVGVVVLQRRLGRYLAAGSTLAAVAAVAGVAQEADLRPVLRRMGAGELVTCALAIAPGDVRGSASSGAWELTGVAHPVPDADIADAVVIAATTEAGPAAFLVESSSSQVRRKALDTMDLSRPLFDLVLDRAPAIRIGALADGVLTPLTALAWAAESLGGAERCLEKTVEYVKSRHAFGRPIGSFQAVKHLCAELYTEVRLSEAILLAAAWMADQSAEGARLHAFAALEQCGRTFEKAAKLTIQLHGGIGFTWEHESHRYLRRAVSSRRILGHEAALERVAPLIGLAG